MRICSRCCALAVLTGLLLSAPIASAVELPQKVTTVEGITEYRLSNGLRILMFPDSSAATVTINLTILVGSRHEGYGETGMAHLLEHLVFKGTPNHPNVPKALVDHGAGGSFNGTTWLDRTNYYETMPATDENLEFGIRLEADRLVNSFIRREDLLSEMTVVRNEFEAGENSPERILSQRMMAVAFEWHNYGKSTIGNRSDIERVPIDRLQAFYRKYYQPDNAVLVVAGKFDQAKALNQVGRYFGPIPRPTRKLENTYTEEPAQDGDRQVILRRVGSIGVVGALYHIPAGAHPDFPAIEVLNEVLVSAPSGRIYKSLIAPRAASSVSGTAWALHDPGVMEITVQVDRVNSLNAVRDTMLATLEQLNKQPVTALEVDRARRKLQNDHELLTTRTRRAGIELSEWAAMGDWRLYFLHRDRLARVTPADVARVAARYLRPNNRTLGMFIPTTSPERADIPATPVVADLVRDYRGSQAVAEGEIVEPTPTAVAARLEQFELPGGLKIGLVPKKTRGQAVTAQLTLRFGNEDSLKGFQSAAEILGQIMLRGTEKKNRQELKDHLDKLQTRLNSGSGFDGNPRSLGQLQFSMESKKQHFVAALKLLGEILREPAFPQDELDILKRQRIASLQRSKTDPMALAMQSIRKKLRPYSQDDIRYVLSLEERLNQMSATSSDQLRRLYQEQISGQAGELIIVGDFDQLPVKECLQEIFKDWKAPTPYRHIARTARIDVPGSKEDIITPDKANAIFVACHLLAMDHQDPDYPALDVADYVLGGGTLSSRLGNRIRQKEGLSYGVQSHIVADAKDKDGQFMVMAICNPANIELVERAVMEELDRLVKDGITAKELADAARAIAQENRVTWASDATVAAMVGNGLFTGHGLTYFLDHERKIKALTVEQVNSAIRKHLSPKRLVIVRGGDFQKKGNKAAAPARPGN